MGECVSICNRDKNDNNFEEDEKNDNMLEPPRTEKNKTRIPKNVITDDEDEEIPITKNITDINIIKEKSNNNNNDNNIKTNISRETEDNNKDLKEKIENARKKWERLKDRLIIKKIEILREMVKKDKKDQKKKINYQKNIK